MRNLVILFILSLSIQSFAFAGINDDNSVQNKMFSYSKSNVSNYSKSNALSGSLSKSQTDANINISDSNDQNGDVLAPQWAPTPSSSNKQESKIYSLWGGLDKNKVSPNIKFDHQIKTLKLLKQENVIDDETYKIELIEIYTLIKKEYQKDKAFGFIPVCDNTLFDMLICW